MSRRDASPAERLVAELRGPVLDDRVLRAMLEVPRDRFVPAALQREAWRNAALPIGHGQTISQPLVVARMCEVLELSDTDRVLDVGTGSGYHAAVLARLARWVWSIERHEALSREAAAALAAAGADNVTLVVGDGLRGLPEEAPFDAINVAAAAGSSAELATLQEQLAPGGGMVVPIDSGEQRLILVRRRPDGGFERQELERVRFVPLIRP